MNVSTPQCMIRDVRAVAVLSVPIAYYRRSTCQAFRPTFGVKGSGECQLSNRRNTDRDNDGRALSLERGVYELADAR